MHFLDGTIILISSKSFPPFKMRTSMKCFQIILSGQWLTISMETQGKYPTHTTNSRDYSSNLENLEFWVLRCSVFHIKLHLFGKFLMSLLSRWWLRMPENIFSEQPISFLVGPGADGVIFSI